MAKNRTVATHRRGDEIFQANIDADNAYPEAIAIARATARELVREMRVDVDAEVAAEVVEVEQPTEVQTDGD